MKGQRIQTQNGFCVWTTWVESQKTYVIRWAAPGKPNSRQKKIDAGHQREADRLAIQFADELSKQPGNAGESHWLHARNRYEEEKLPSLKADSQTAWYSAVSWLESFGQPEQTRDVTTSFLSQLSAFMRKGGLAETSIASYLGQLRAMLGWCLHVDLIEHRPRFDMPHRRKHSKMMRGRPLITEEFERMLAEVADVCGQPAETSWQHLLNGLWLSGLRIGEAVELYWDRVDKLHIYGLDRRRPKMRIIDELEKGHQDRLLAITPDFVNFLRSTPDIHRHGPVFTPRLKTGQETRSVETWKKRIIAMGKGANVKVDDKNNKVKYASAHDLRRTFGSRWALKVRPLVLKELMRHSSIETTQKYYVGLDAERTANEVWDVFEREFGEQTGDSRDERFRALEYESS